MFTYTKILKNIKIFFIKLKMSKKNKLKSLKSQKIQLLILITDILKNFYIYLRKKKCNHEKIFKYISISLGKNLYIYFLIKS